MTRIMKLGHNDLSLIFGASIFETCSLKMYKCKYRGQVEKNKKTHILNKKENLENRNQFKQCYSNRHLKMGLQHMNALQ